MVEEASRSAKLICQLVKRTGKQRGMGQIGQSVGGTSVLRQYSFGYSDGSCKPSRLIQLRYLSTFAGKKVVYPFEGRLISWVAREFDVRNVSVLRRGTHE